MVHPNLVHTPAVYRTLAKKLTQSEVVTSEEDLLWYCTLPQTTRPPDLAPTK